MRSAEPSSTPAWWERTRVALALASAALVATAGCMGLFEPTETRYAEIAREMRASGDWLLPHLDGLVHLDKPPFAYWATVLGMSVFGENGWGARLPVAAATMCTLALAAIAARRRFAPLVTSRALTVWLLATMALPFVLGRTLGSDAFLAPTVAGFWALAPSPWAIALLGLGCFIKGPVVLVPTLLPVLAAAAWGRSRVPLTLLGSRRGWAWFVAIALPWYAVMTARVPGLADWLLGNQLWERFATHVHHREGRWWYFAAVVAAGALPWSAALIAGVARAWRERAREESRLLLAWLAVPVVFFSFSGSKLPGYVLPAFPAAAMLAGIGLARGGRGVRWATALTLAGLVVAAAALGPRVLAHVSGAAGAVAALPPLAWLALALWTIAAIVAASAQRAAAPAAALMLAGWVALAGGLARYEGPLGSPRPLARVLAENRGASEPVIEYRHFNAGLPFYLRERVRLLEVDRERSFTPPAAQSEVFVTRDSLPAFVARHGRVWLLAPGDAGATLADSAGLTFARVSAWRRETLGFLAPADTKP